MGGASDRRWRVIHREKGNGMLGRLIGNLRAPRNGHPCGLAPIVGAGLALAVTGSLVAGTGPAALAGGPYRNATAGDVGQRWGVCAHDLTVRQSPGGRVIGTLYGSDGARPAQSFTISGTGEWVRGHAWGEVNRDGYVQNGWFCPDNPPQPALGAAPPPAALPAHLATAAVAGSTGSKKKKKWTTGMRLNRPGGCWLYPGLRNTTQQITGHRWHHSTGYLVGWRYRVNKIWSLVLDYGRQNVKYKPRWAFVETSCLKGNIYPALAKDSHGRVRDLWGKASHGWRHVRFGTSPQPGVHTTGVRRIAVTYTTMRDKPHAFATGNLFHNEKFRITGRCTSHHKGPHGASPWIYGLDLQSHRWGWIPSAALNSDPCLAH
jgi:hypothetical protein